MTVEGQEYRTAEHAFQSLKFRGTPHEAIIAALATPALAAQEGRSRSRPMRRDWEDVKLPTMRRIVRAKFHQHLVLQDLLTDTYPRYIAEHTVNDKIWGDGGDGTGSNWLGLCLMEVRQELVVDRHVNAPGPSKGRRTWSVNDHWGDGNCDLESCGCCRALANNLGANYLLNHCDLCSERMIADINRDHQAAGEARQRPDGGSGDRRRGGDGGDGGGGRPRPPPGASRGRRAASDFFGETKGGDSDGEAAEPGDDDGEWLARFANLGIDDHRRHNSIALDDGYARTGAEDADVDPGRPRKGPAWPDILPEQQRRIAEVQILNAADIHCRHRLEVGGKFGGRLLVPPATPAGLRELTCCSYTQGYTEETRCKAAPPGAVLPTQTLNLAAMRGLVEAVADKGGPVFHDPGLWDMMEHGIRTGYTGGRQGITVFDVNPKTQVEPARALVDKATKKDLAGLKDPEGVSVPNIVNLGKTAKEAVASLRAIFPQLEGSDEWLLCFAVGVVEASIGRKARIVDDQSKGDEPLSMNNNTFAFATPRLQLGGSNHFQAELREMIKGANGRRIFVALADFKSWFRQSKLAGADAPVNVYRCPITGDFMLRLGSGFGAKTLPASTSRMTVAVAFLLIYQDELRAHLYIDDCALLAYEDEPMVEMWEKMLSTFKRCNIHVSADKLVPWAELVDFLGITYDIPRRIIRVTASRRERMLLIYSKILATPPGGRVKSKILSSAYHSTLSIDQIIDGSRAFLYELGRLLRHAVRLETNPKTRGYGGVRVTALLRLELEWWQTLLQENKGDALVGALCKRKAAPAAFPIRVATDASTSGAGGVYECPRTGGVVYFEHTFDAQELRYMGDVCRARGAEAEGADKVTIAALELWTVVAAAEIFHPELQGEAGEPPRVHSWQQDNQNVCCWINQEWSKSPNPLVALLLRHLFFLERKYNFRILCIWVASADNIAPDALSRQNFSLFKSLTATRLCTSRQVPLRFRMLLTMQSTMSSGWEETPTPRKLSKSVSEAGPLGSFLAM